MTELGEYVATLTPKQREEFLAAVQALVDQAPEFSEAKKAALRVLLNRPKNVRKSA